MAKLDKSHIITKDDMLEYLNDRSDFGFELKVLNQLLKYGYKCEHGGTYIDPVTQKPREFDIRASKQIDNQVLRLAVECKYLHEYYPLLVSCVPRREKESFHHIIYSRKHQGYIRHAYNTNSVIPSVETGPRSTQAVAMRNAFSLYKEGNSVGKTCIQIGKKEQQDGLTWGDDSVYDKWSQALSSAHDLVMRACEEGEWASAGSAYTFVLPVLVVPDNTLWIAEYNTVGDLTKDPYQTNRCEYYVNFPYAYKDVFHQENIILSHLEIITLNKLAQHIDSFFDYFHSNYVFDNLDPGFLL